VVNCDASWLVTAHPNSAARQTCRTDVRAVYADPNALSDWKCAVLSWPVSWLVTAAPALMLLAPYLNSAWPTICDPLGRAIPRSGS
jgi:hypothetical protein